jgi:hypothetical protein
MQGLLASLRLPFVFRGLLGPAAAGAATATSVPSPDPVAALSAAHAMDAGARLAPMPRGYVEALEDFSFVVEAPVAPAPKPLPVEPSVRVAAAHLVDPIGIRVVPFRPVTRWPLRRAAPRIYDPFRGFPHRSAHLADLMDAGGRAR